MITSANHVPIKLAVLTGGHCFDVPAFQSVFKAMDDVDYYIQTVGDFSMSSPEIRKSYDAVLFYHMLMDGPVDEGQWYESQQKTAIEELLAGSQGIVILHHALLAWPHWQPWSRAVGINNRAFDYLLNQNLNVKVLDSAHPITQGMTDFTMPDETYTMEDAGTDSHILLTVDHPKSMKTIAWTRQPDQARIFCFQSGHDGQAFVDQNYRRILRRGVLWSAGRLSFL